MGDALALAIVVGGDDNAVAGVRKHLQLLEQRLLLGIDKPLTGETPRLLADPDSIARKIDDMPPGRSHRPAFRTLPEIPGDGLGLCR